MAANTIILLGCIEPTQAHRHFVVRVYIVYFLFFVFDAIHKHNVIER
jgi:hypothetical protein